MRDNTVLNDPAGFIMTTIRNIREDHLYDSEYEKHYSLGLVPVEPLVIELRSRICVALNSVAHKNVQPHMNKALEALYELRVRGHIKTTPIWLDDDCPVPVVYPAKDQEAAAIAEVFEDIRAYLL